MRQPLRIQPGALRRFKFLVDIGGVPINRVEQIAIKADKIAVDVPLLNNALDHRDGSCMAFRCQSRAIMPVQGIGLLIGIVDFIREVRRGPTGFAATERTIVNDDDFRAFAREQVCSS